MPDPTLHTEVQIHGTDEVQAKLKEMEKTGTEAANNIAGASRKAAEEMMEWGSKAQRFGSIMTQYVTVPLAAISAGAIKITTDIMQSEEAMSHMSDTGQAKMIALKASVDDLSQAWLYSRLEIAEGTAPVMIKFLDDVVTPLTAGIGDLAGRFDDQSEAAKLSEIALLALVATAPLVIGWSATVVTAIGAATLAFGTATVAAWGLYAAIGAVVAGVPIAIIALEDWYAARAGIEPQRGPAPGSQQSEQLRAMMGGSVGATGIPSTSAIDEARADAEMRARMFQNINIPRGGGGGGAVPVHVDNAAEIAMAFSADQLTRLAQISAGMTYGPGGFLEYPEMRPPHAPGYQGLGRFGGMTYAEYYGRQKPHISPGELAYQEPGIGLYRPEEKGVPFYQSGNWWTQFAATTAGAGAAGGWEGAASAALPMIGMAVGGPTGAAVGSLTSMLFGRKGRGEHPSNPVYVEMVNPEMLATALAVVMKSVISRIGAQDMDNLVKQIHSQSGAKGLH